MLEKDLKNSYSKICCVVYDLENVKQLVNFSRKHSFNYYYIRHDDFDENLEEKKRHYHFIIESDSYHRFNIKSLITDTLKINLFQKLKNVDLYLRYMVHVDYVDKRQYSINRIVSNVSYDIIKNRIENALFSQTDLNRLNFNIIVKAVLNGSLSSLSDIIVFCVENDIKYSTSWTFTLNSLLKEYNLNKKY